MPTDLLAICESEEIPLVYDVHHHRCNRDALSEQDATTRAMATWNREPPFHVSSPLEGWKGKKLERHHDFITLRDFPIFWEDLDITVEVEAKTKELAVCKLRESLNRRTRRRGRRVPSAKVQSVRQNDQRLYLDFRTPFTIKAIVPRRHPMPTTA